MYLTAEGKQTIYSYEESYAQAFIRNMNEDLNDVKRSFIKIGFRLTEANECKYYEELGYKNITELAEAEFGFKTSTTYEFMKVYELAHDEQCRISISKEYDKYSYSQLLALTYLKYSKRNARMLVRPTDSVRDIKRFVSIWNEEAKHWNSYDVYPEIRTVDEYLKAYDEKRAKENTPQVSEYSGQLPGQIAMDAELPEEEFSERSENTEQGIAVSEEAAAPMQDSELIKYCLKEGSWTQNGKFRILRSHAELMRSAFVKFVKNEYGNGSRGVHGEPYRSLESNSNGYTIVRASGGKIVLTWSVVAGHISRMIEAGEYLTAEEQEQYKKWQTEHNGFAISLPTMPEPDEPEEEFSERSENSLENDIQQAQKREYHLTVKKETIAQLMEAMITEHCNLESSKVSKLEDELKKQTNDKFYSYHFSDLAEFIIETEMPEDNYTDTYCSILALLGIGVTE